MSASSLLTELEENIRRLSLARKIHKKGSFPIQVIVLY